MAEKFLWVEDDVHPNELEECREMQNRYIWEKYPKLAKWLKWPKPKGRKK